MAYLGGWTSISVRDTQVIAHELGHNLRLGHTPGVGRTVDPEYPYSGTRSASGATPFGTCA